ncbi:MAG: cytochrome b/b6 domain-containing protein, partial [Planctomycetota bacterium]
MHSTTANPVQALPSIQRIYVWQWPIRIFHWVVALSVVALFVSGWLIAEPLLGSSGEPFDHFVMGRIRQVHIIAAMAFTLAFVWRSIWFFLGNRHARSGFPSVWKASWWADLARQAGDYMKLEAGDPHLGHNSLAGLSYTLFVVGLGLVQIFTGFALYGQAAP